MAALAPVIVVTTFLCTKPMTTMLHFPLSTEAPIQSCSSLTRAVGLWSNLGEAVST